MLPIPIGIQLGHAGRKGSAQRPWEGRGALSAAEGAWQTVAPSAVALAAGWRALRLALLTMGAIALVQVWYARELASFMIADPEVIDLTVVFIYMLAACLPMMACDLTLAGALRGAGETRFPLKSTFCGMVFGRLIPAGIFLSLELSVYWIYAVMLFDYSIKAAMLVRRYHSRKWLGLGNPTADPTKSLQL